MKIFASEQLVAICDWDTFGLRVVGHLTRYGKKHLIKNVFGDERYSANTVTCRRFYQYTLPLIHVMAQVYL